MLRHRPFLSTVLLATVLAAGCKKDQSVTVFTGYRYYPDNVGHAVVYDVDSIYLNSFNPTKPDTVEYQIREVIESVFQDNEGRPTLRLERYRRSTPGDPWVIYQVWTANVDLKGVEKKEDNITYQKLVFPAKLNARWDGNAKNTKDRQDYEITDLNVSGTAGGVYFDSTLSVLQNDLDILYYKKLFDVERYATGVGLIYKDHFEGDYDGPNIKYFDHYTETFVSYEN